MPRADRNTLRHSRIELDRQQRQEQPEVSGATGNPNEGTPEVAEVKARKRRGKTEKHTSDDTPTPAA
ncbi:MAG: hypothetical protein ACJ8DC_13910 [Gemmatimonadales bacterium]